MGSRVCVFGAGGVGGFIAATIAHGGCDVSVVARGAHLERIRADGLTLERSGHETLHVRLPASDDPREFGPQDLVIVTTKTTALEHVARSIDPLIGPHSAVAFACNGIYWFYGHHPLPTGMTPRAGRLQGASFGSRRLGTARTLGIVVRSPNEVIAPGIVRNQGGGRFVVGGVDAEAWTLAEDVAAELSAFGLQAVAVPDIRAEMWRKLLGNVCSSLLCCLTGATITEVLGSPHARRVGRAVMAEVAEIARRHGFGDLPDYVDEELDRQASLAAKPSMLQDLERGRALELDAQLLVLVDFADQLAMPAPTLRTLVDLLLYRLERTHGPD